MIVTITFKHDQGKTAQTRIFGIPDIGVLTTLIPILDSFSDMAITLYTVTETVAISGTLDTGDYDSIEEKAHMTFRDLNLTEKRTVTAQLPAPLNAVLEEKRSGLRVVWTVGDSVATALGSATGKSLQYIKGHHRCKRLHPVV